MWELQPASQCIPLSQAHPQPRGRERRRHPTCVESCVLEFVAGERIGKRLGNLAMVAHEKDGEKHQLVSENR